MALVSFETVAYRTCTDAAFWASLWDRATRETVRMGVFGDSTALIGVVSTGTQDCWSTHFLRELRVRFGNIPETPICKAGTDNNAMWPVKHYKDGSSIGTTRLAAATILPGVSPATYISTGNGTIGLLDWNCATAGTGDTSTAWMPVFWPRTTAMVADIFAATNESSGEIVWYGRPTGANSTSTTEANLSFDPDTTNGTTTLGLQSATSAIKKASVALDWGASKAYMQLQLKGSSATQTDVIGFRFRNTANVAGVAPSFYSAGGYTCATLAASHANAGPMLQAFGCDVAFVSYGINDMIVDGQTAAQFQARLVSVISTIRTLAGNPALPVILRAGCYTRAASNANPAVAAALSAGNQTEYDKYPDAAAQVALADSRVLAINTRRWTHESGFNLSGYVWWSKDGVHFNTSGASRVAAADVALMLGTATTGGGNLRTRR